VAQVAVCFHINTKHIYYSVGREYCCWMLNWWCITWPVCLKEFNEILPRESTQDNYGAGMFEGFRSSDWSINKGANQSRTAKNDVYIFFKKRPYGTGYMLQILLKFVVMITKKNTRLVQMVSTRSAILSCSYHRHCSVVRPRTKLQVMSIHTASRHAFANSYIPWQSTRATPRTVCDG